MSSVRNLIEQSLRVQSGQVQSDVPVITLQYGIDFKHQRLNAMLNSRAVVVCGGCNQGWVYVKDDKGRPTQEKKQHVDCKGVGFRLNRKYGRAGRGKYG